MSVPIVFLHGWAMNGAIFDAISDRLGADFQCYAPDLPGHGRRMAETPSLDACAEMVRQTVNPLDHPILVGWSMGAAAAWRYIAQHGTNGLGGLVTVDMSPRMASGDGWHLGMIGQTQEDMCETSAKIIPRWPNMVKGIMYNMYSETHGNTVVEGILKSQNPEQLKPLWDDMTAMDERQTVPKIDVPYLVCTGQKSRLYRSEVADWIANNAPNAEVELFQNSGHSPHLEEPDAFCGAIRRFVEANYVLTQTTDKKASG